MSRHKRQEAEIERSRSLILQSAARVFAKKGYQASSMAAVAREAGYTAPTLYTYFAGKADIFDDLVDIVLTAINAVYEEHEPAGMSFGQKLELLLLRQFKVIDQHSDAFAFFLTLSARGESSPADSRKRKRHQSEALSLRQQMTSWLDENLAASDFASLRPSLVEIFISGVLMGFASRWAEGPRDEPLSRQISLVMPLILGGLAGLKRSEAS